jgi:hypothetical protein
MTLAHLCAKSKLHRAVNHVHRKAKAKRCVTLGRCRASTNSAACKDSVRIANSALSVIAHPHGKCSALIDNRFVILRSIRSVASRSVDRLSRQT